MIHYFWLCRNNESKITAIRCNCTEYEIEKCSFTGYPHRSSEWTHWINSLAITINDIHVVTRNNWKHSSVHSLVHPIKNSISTKYMNPERITTKERLVFLVQFMIELWYVISFLLLTFQFLHYLSFSFVYSFISTNFSSEKK